MQTYAVHKIGVHLAVCICCTLSSTLAGRGSRWRLILLRVATTQNVQLGSAGFQLHVLCAYI